MGEILGLGITHYPGLSYKGNLNRRINMLLGDPLLPEHLRSPETWHPTMREQWSNDEGLAHSEKHRNDMIHYFRKARAELDAFEPDFVLLWADDQYENFREDGIPPLALLAYDSVDFQPWAGHQRGENWWDEPADKTFTMTGHRKGAKHLASALLRDGIDVAYAYKPRHHPLGHGFANSLLYLDFDRKGFPYPVVPFAINAYGRWVISAHGAPMTPSQAAKLVDEDLDPPGPQPWRCFQVGAAVARAITASPYRVGVIASSSWSHSFLVEKNARMFPDTESDKRYHAALRDADWAPWRTTTIEEAEDRGHHELLNWFCLAGAMSELGRKPDECTFLESWISNSNKVFAVFRP